MPRAALFDMDRTLVRKETVSLYVKYQRAQGERKLAGLQGGASYSKGSLASA